MAEKENSKNSGELVVKEAAALQSYGEYSALQIETAELAEVMRENLGGQALTPNDLQRIKVPSGGGIVWEIPTLDDTEDVAEFEGIIVFHKFQNAYWREEYDGSNNPPDCAAPDAEYGIGDPGGACAKCPMNEFGTARKGAGKACKNTKILFILREGQILPTALNVPPTSLRSVKNYLLSLASAGITYYGAITKFGLEKDKNVNGITYSKIVLRLKEKLPLEIKTKVKQYHLGIRPALEQVVVAEYTATEE